MYVKFSRFKLGFDPSIIINSKYNKENIVYKECYIGFVLDMTNALNDFEKTGDKQEVLDVMEEFKCRML